ncbi:MAG: phosphoribosylanthranilate isomerase [Haloarculaceae archaeon]
MARAKICGITGREDLEAAVDAGAAAIGLVADVSVDTPREVEPAVAEELAALTPPFVTATLVTMPETPAAAVTLADLVGADAVQLHGLQPSDCAIVAESFGGRVLAAVDPERDDLAAYDGAVDALLVDSLDEAGAGGTGETADWERTREAVAALRTPVVLAGGLTPENVTEAIRTVEPYAVDVASGVEREGGVKDHDAVGAFVERAWRADR